MAAIQEHTVRIAFDIRLCDIPYLVEQWGNLTEDLVPDGLYDAMLDAKELVGEDWEFYYRVDFLAEFFPATPEDQFALWELQLLYPPTVHNFGEVY